MPKIVIIIGNIGSGKSTAARAYALWSPDITDVIQEVLDRPNWAGDSGNSYGEDKNIIILVFKCSFNISPNIFINFPYSFWNCRINDKKFV